MYRLILATTTDDDAPMLDITEHDDPDKLCTMLRDTTDPDDRLAIGSIPHMLAGSTLTVYQGGAAVAVVVRL